MFYVLIFICSILSVLLDAPRPSSQLLRQRVVSESTGRRGGCRCGARAAAPAAKGHIFWFDIPDTHTVRHISYACMPSRAWSAHVCIACMYHCTYYVLVPMARVHDCIVPARATHAWMETSRLEKCVTLRRWKVACCPPPSGSYWCWLS